MTENKDLKTTNSESPSENKDQDVPLESENPGLTRNRHDNEDTSSHGTRSEYILTVEDKLAENYRDMAYTVEDIQGIQLNATAHVDPVQAEIIKSNIEAVNRSVSELEQSMNELKDNGPGPGEVQVDTTMVRNILELEERVFTSFQESTRLVDNKLNQINPDAIASTGNSEIYNNRLSALNEQVSSRATLAAEFEEELKQEDEKNILLEEQQEEKGVGKRAREDSEEEEGESSENKKQKTEEVKSSGSLLDDYADTSLEFPGYTDGDD